MKLDLTVGQTASRTTTVTEEHVRSYAEISGDYNPLHFDPDFAARTRFGRLVAQGGLTTGILHALVALERAGSTTPAGAILLGRSAASHRSPHLHSASLALPLSAAERRRTHACGRRRDTGRSTAARYSGQMCVSGRLGRHKGTWWRCGAQPRIVVLSLICLAAIQ